MRRMLLVVALFGTVAVAGSVLAQGPGGPGGFGKRKGPPSASGSASGPDRIQRIEGELAQIHEQLDRIEALLRKSSGFEKKGGWAKGWEKKGFGGGLWGFDKGAAWGNKGFRGPRGFAWKDGKGFEKKRFGPPDFEKKGFDKKSFDKKDGPKGFDKKDAGPSARGRAESPSVEQQLEQIQREIGELRRVLKKQ